MAHGTPGLAELEVEVRQRLQGVQLVCETGTSADTPYFLYCLSVLNAYLEKHQIGSLSRDCPAVFVLVLTAIGAKLGSGGQLWEPILDEDLDGLHLVGLEHSNTGKFGEQFRKSLRVLNLPDFSHIEGRTNLTPILMHGGIPLHSSEVVWRKVQEFVRSGTTSGREIIQELRSDRIQMRYFNQPAQRFIREAGTFAADMIERMANVVLSFLEDPESSSEVLGSRHGLPTSFVEVLQGSIASEGAISIGVPAAHIYLDLNSGRGPYCYLPRVRERFDDVLWTVCGRNYRASRFDERPVLLEPASPWTVEALVDGKRLRTRIFPSLADSGVWLFAETRSGAKLIEPSHGIEEGHYFLLAPTGVQARIDNGTGTVMAQDAEVGGLGDAWSQHHVLRMNLVGSGSFQLIRASDGSPIGKAVEVLPAPFRPSLEGDECFGIQEIDGLRVFSEPPRIEFASEGGIIDGFNLAIRDPQGVWIQNALSSSDVTDRRIELGTVIEWVTGEYRIEVVGPMGTGGMSETFVVLLNGRLEMEERLFSPSEVVSVSLVFRRSPDGGESSISADFGAFEYRKDVSWVDNSVLLSLTIPRVSFDIGGVDMPPKFEFPSRKILGLEDLEKPRGRRLFVRTGRPAELTVVARGSNNLPFHKEKIVTSGLNASGAIEIDPILESIRLCGVGETEVELCMSDHVRIAMLTIQQVLDFRIKECQYQIKDDETSGQAIVEVTTSTDSPNARVLVQSLERVWEAPVVGALLERKEESGIRVAVCEPIPPGRYSVELAVGTSTQPIPSTRRVKDFGSEVERTKYLASIAGDSSRLAERIVAGESISRAEMSECSHDDFLRVLHFFVLRHREFPTKSPEFVSAVKCIASEGRSREICRWMTRMGAEVTATRDLEIFVVRLFSVFLDDPLAPSVDASGDGENDDDVLVARLWAISPLIGLTFTHRMSSDAVNGYIGGLGPPEAEPDYELLAGLTWPELDDLIAQTDDISTIFSRGYAMVNFKRLWRQCWSRVGLDQTVMDRLSAWIERGKELMEATFAGRPYELPKAIASTVPSQFRPGRNNENLVIAKFIHNIFRLAWLAARAETPYENALQACEVLAESYGLSKGLSDRALMLAIAAERRGDLANV